MSPKVHRALAQSAVALACALGASAPAFTQDAERRAIAKWRPTEGTYAVPGNGFAEACGEFGDLIIGLREKDISGHEWSCIDATAQGKAEAEQKKQDKKAARQPRDGVYASPGADFDDRCMKSGDAVVVLAKSALSIGSASCYVAHVSVEPPNSVTLNVNCGGQGVVTRAGSILGSNSAETVTLSRTDDQSMLFRRFRNGQAAGSDQHLRYCPEAAQRDFTESKTK